MKGSVAASIGLHVAILAIALLGLPDPNPYKIKPQPAIMVDISNIGDVSKRMAMSKEAEAKPAKPAPRKTEKVAKADPLAKVADEVKKAAKEPKAEPPPPEAKKEPPKEEPKKAEEPKPLDPDPLKDLIKDTVAEAAEPKKEPPKKEETKKAEARPQKKPDKKPEKKKQKLDVDQLEAFLNKVDEEKTSPSETSSIDGSPAKGEANLQGTDDQLSATIIEALVQSIRKCWSVPPGAREANVIVKVHFGLNPDGTVIGVPEVMNGTSDPLFDATARSAVAAVMECQAYSFLPQDQYDLWKDLIINFNPNMMFDS